MGARTGHSLTANLKRRIQAFEHKCLRKLLRISYTEQKTNEYVRMLVTILAGCQEPLLAMVKRRKVTYGPVSRHDSLSKTILQGTVEGKQRRGRPRKSWSDNVKHWMDQPTAQTLRATENRHRWRVLTAETAIMPP